MTQPIDFMALAAAVCNVGQERKLNRVIQELARYQVPYLSEEAEAILASIEHINPLNLEQVAEALRAGFNSTRPLWARVEELTGEPNSQLGLDNVLRQNLDLKSRVERMDITVPRVAEYLASNHSYQCRVKRVHNPSVCECEVEPLIKALNAVTDKHRAYLFPLRSMIVTCRKHGYSLTLHGSRIRDLDVVAVAWTPEAITPHELIDILCREHNLNNLFGPEEKPHGRLAWSLQALDMFCSIIDISIMGPK